MDNTETWQHWAQKTEQRKKKKIKKIKKHKTDNTIKPNYCTYHVCVVQPTISKLEMPIPIQGHCAFPSFLVVD